MVGGMPPLSASHTQAVLHGARYSVDPTTPISALGPGFRAFAAVDHRSGSTGLMGIVVERHAPARAAALPRLGDRIDNLLTPMACEVGSAGDGTEALYLICPAPPGRSLADRPGPWPEATLITQVLRPIAAVLEALQARGLTHRAVRADNVFDTGPGAPVVLGPAWAAPPAMHQPALFEPPYSAAAHPAARGDGTIADDVYALGVLLIVLALGRNPLAELDEAAVLRLKLAHGSFAALTARERLPPVIAD